MARKIGERLACIPTIINALLIHTLLQAPGGFIQTAFYVQQTGHVFFPLHMAAWRCAAFLSWLGFDVCAQKTDKGPIHPCATWKCTACGLLHQSRQHARAHIKDHHAYLQPSVSFIRVLRPMCSPILTLAATQGGQRDDPTPWSSSRDTIEANMARIAKASTSKAGLSCSETSQWASLLHCLLSFATFRAEEGVVRVHTCVSAFYCFLGANKWRHFKKLWSAIVSITLTGLWKGCDVAKFGPSRDTAAPCFTQTHRMESS